MGEQPAAWNGSPRQQRARRRTVVVVVATVVALAVVVGAVVLVTSLLRSDQPVTPLGDPQTADPCSLIDPSAFTRVGSIDPPHPATSLSACVMLLSPTDGPPVLVTVGFFLPTEFHRPPPPPQQQVGDVEVTRAPRNPLNCTRLLTLRDNSVIDVTASFINLADDTPAVTGPADLCALADVATQTALAKLTSHNVGRLPPDTRPWLRNIDTCALIAPAADSSLTGGAAPTSTFANRGCVVDHSSQTSAPGRYEVSLRVDSGLRGQTRQLGHHLVAQRSAPASGPEPASCNVEIVQGHYQPGRYQDPPFADTVEIDYAPSAASSNDPCAEITPLVTDIESKLPPPS